MVFNSGVFVVFFVIVFLTYWLLQRLPGGTRIQNRFLLAASYFFYGYWDWIFLSLILISTLVDYLVAIGLERASQSRNRKLLLATSVVVNIGLLGTFKYFDFFVTGFVDLVHLFLPAAFPDQGQSLLLRAILPVGISFYTFQTLSYTIDVYRRKITAEHNFFDFALFVCFFPQLVAGPIERAAELLPQLKKPREWTTDHLLRGTWLILIGFFMKVYVADNLAPLVNRVYLDGAASYAANPELAAGHGGFQVILASIGFAFQIYCDFAGYSAIALGTALLMGIRLSVNFDIPEVSQNPVELWRRWHVTLNRWITDYVYISLGGGRLGAVIKYRNILTIFVLMGLWHGANWTFLLWGLYHGIWMMLYRGLGPHLPRLPESTPRAIQKMIRLLKAMSVFGVFALSATFFRAYDLNHVIELWRSLIAFPWDAVSAIQNVPAAAPYALDILKKISLLLILDGAAYLYRDYFWIFKRPVWVRVSVYAMLFYSIIVLGDFGREVIYFAF